ncbi:sugar ABC transporter permease [Candidatus Nomurabacteria bacterium]|nr:sugar ABC transporter permease [Candidatus Nomurabacteria bacterium]
MKPGEAGVNDLAKNIIKNKNRNMNPGTLRHKRGIYGWIFVSPFILGFLLIYLWVFVESFRFSISSITMDVSGLKAENAGFDNYFRALRIDPDYARILVESIGNTLKDIPLVIIFSLFIATILNAKMKGRALFRAVFFLPVILATGIIQKAEMSNILLNSAWSMDSVDIGVSGAGTQGLSLISYEEIVGYFHRFAMNRNLANYLVGAINDIYSVVNRCGVQMLVFLAGLQSIPDSIYESARVEGATGWEKFWKITIPMISPIIFVNMIYTIIDSFTSYENPLIDYIYKIAFDRSNYSLGSAMAWTYFAVIALLLMIISLFTYRYVFYQQKK